MLIFTLSYYVVINITVTVPCFLFDFFLLLLGFLLNVSKLASRKE